MEDVYITLSLSQAENLMDFFETEFLRMLREDPDINNLDYVADMCAIYMQVGEQKKKAKDYAELKLKVPAKDIIDINPTEEVDDA